ncbi:MAG: polysaccharide export protein [Flavisolibacter sp.]|jgi:polysaccharide export outer membrane protein|nr:polysaccharide export protein [Flavisolibacter sp.]
MKILFLAGFIGVILVSSCGTQGGSVTNYLEKSKDTTGTSVVQLSEPVIQKNDLLSIKVYSLSANPAIDALYNLPEQTVAGSSTVGNTAGFLVDNEGNIEYPRLGVFHVEGLKKAQLAQVIKKSLDTILKSPSVIVRFLNYRITILGEVRTPGTFTIPTEKVTILEALGIAGDITEYGNKATVKIMRETSGQASIQTVDLTSKDIFASPFYRLQQNDVVFVEQTTRKLRQQEQQSFAQQLGIATGIITAIALILNFIR